MSRVTTGNTMRVAMLSFTLFSLALATVAAWTPPSFTRQARAARAVRSLEGKSLAYAGAIEAHHHHAQARVPFTAAARYRPSRPATATATVTTARTRVTPRQRTTTALLSPVCSSSDLPRATG